MSDEPTNEDRAGWAEAGLLEFAIDSGEFFKLVPKAHISMESSDG